LGASRLSDLMWIIIAINATVPLTMAIIVNGAV
jgi:hypothetical protein